MELWGYAASPGTPLHLPCLQARAISWTAGPPLPFLSPGNLVCPEPGLVAQDEEVGAGAWRLSGWYRRPSCRRGGKNGVRASPGSPSAGEKGRPCSFPNEASLPSFQEIRGGFPPLASLSVFPPVSTLLGGLGGGEGQVPSGEELPLVFSVFLFPLNFPL